MSILRIAPTRRRRWPWALVLAAVLGGLGAAWSPGDVPRLVAVVVTDPVAAAPAPQLATQVAPAPSIAPQSTQATPSQAHCPEQQLDLTVNGRAERVCVGATRVNQSGDMRTLLLETHGTPAWKLAIDTGQGAVMAVRLRGPDAVEYGCEGDACSGLLLSRRDRHGARTLQSRNATLRPTADGAWPQGAVALNASLKVASDEQDPALACAGAKLSIAQDGGGLQSFCPAGGVSLAMLEAGRRAFTLRNLEGENLVVVVDEHSVVERVELEGLSCHGANCAGVTVAATVLAQDGAWGRVFDFAGTSLYAPGASIRLQGRLVTPAL